MPHFQYEVMRTGGPPPTPSALQRSEESEMETVWILLDVLVGQIFGVKSCQTYSNSM